MDLAVRRGRIPESTWGDTIVRLLSRQHTTRTTRTVATTLAAGALGLSAALLAVSPASAADPSTITFNGNCGLIGLGYSSTPAVDGKADTEATTVGAGTQLTIVNNLTVPAVLAINGQNQAPTVPAGKSIGYQANTGPIKLTLTPQCGINVGTSKAITVTVTPAAAQSPTGNGNGSGQTGTGTGTTGNGSQSGTQSGSKSGSQAQQPPATSPNGGTRVPQLPAIHGPVARGAVPSGAADPNKDSGTSGGDTSSTTTPAGGKVRLADPKPLSDVGPTGTTSLLALIAAVCLVGVGVAAFRTVFGGRQANRAAAST
jgi:hypothetical protein